MKRKRVSLLLAIVSMVAIAGALLPLADPASLNLPMLVALFGVEPASSIFESPVWLTRLTITGFIGAGGYTVLRFGVWWQQRMRRGSGLLLSSAVLGAVPPAWSLLMAALTQPWYGDVTFPAWAYSGLVAVARIPAQSWWGTHAVSLLLLAAGVARSGIVSRKIGFVGLAAATLALAASIELYAQGTTFPLFELSAITEAAFLIGLSVSLALQSVRPVPSPDVPAATRSDAA